MRRTITALATLLVLVGVPASPAQARNGWAEAADGAARTEYIDVGDIICVTDQASDGHGAAGWIEIRQEDGSYNRFPKIYNGNTAAGDPVCVHQDVQRETARVKVVSCLQDGSTGTAYNCGIRFTRGD